MRDAIAVEGATPPATEPAHSDRRSTLKREKGANGKTMRDWIVSWEVV